MPPEPWPQIAFALTTVISFFTIVSAGVRFLRPYFRSPVDRSIETARFNLDASDQVIDALQAQLALFGADRVQDRQRITALEAQLDGDWQQRAAAYRDLLQLQDENRILARERDSLARRLADVERAQRDHTGDS